jgi:uncharacterized protein YndB with AHSA1/START domain
VSQIEVDVFFPHEPAKVWRALTTSDLLAQWLMANDFEPVIGHRFTFRTDPAPDFDGTIQCEVLSLKAEDFLIISWCSGPAPNTTVTWRVVAEDGGTRLFVTHAGFDDDSDAQRSVRDILELGWREHLPQRLGQLLTTLSASPRR